MFKLGGRIHWSSMIFLVAAACRWQAADAQDRVHFDLPAQSLAKSLQAIGIATHTDVGFNATEVAGRTAPELKADLTLDDALARVLEGTGLRPQHLNDHAVVIAEPGPIASESVGPENTDRSDSKDLAEILVTGTHIRGIENKTSSVIVIDRAQIDQSGYSSTQDLFRSLPQNFSGGDASEDGILTGNNGAFQNKEMGSGIDLRGLGASSTLVLLNGHRLAPSASGTFVDVSQIPLAAIDRVEILTDGSSAIYGSDAVGGVVNIILKKDYQGADTSVRYGASTRGGRDESLVAQTLGTNWSSGNVVSTVQFQRQGSLPAEDRTFSSALPYPNDLLPQTRSYSGTLDGRQSLNENLEFYGDVLLSRRAFSDGQSQLYPGYGLDLTEFDGDTQAIDVTPGLRYTFGAGWSVELSGLYGYQKYSDQDAAGFAPGLVHQIDINRFTAKSGDLVVSGPVGRTSAGDIGVAVGASYRTEDLDTVTPLSTGASGRTQQDRHVSAEFAELHVPLVGAANRRVLVEALELSAAVRRDQYSDFGSTTNPRVGVRWAPLRDIALRAAYGKSFRAPSVFEESLEDPDHSFIYNFEVPNPAGTGVTELLAANGSKKLTPERARTVNFGLEYKPLNIKGLTVGLDYFDIRFENRIITPPFPINVLQQQPIYGSLISPVASDAAAQAIVDAAVAAGAQYTDGSPSGTGISGVRYFYDDRQQNAALVRQSGLDFLSTYAWEIGTHTLTTRINLGFIDKIDTQFAAGAGFANLVNTISNPPRWRGRLTSTWSGTGLSFSAALNAVGSYVNTAALGSPSIASWVTADLNATVNLDAYLQSRIWQGFSMSLVILNVLDRDPPYVMNATATYPVNYDPTNANALGRFVAIALRKKW